MRRFIVIGHEAHTSPDFSLEDIPGTSGRIDVLARCAATSFLLSHGIRKDVELYLVLCGPSSPPKTIRMVGAELKYLNPDERSTTALFLKALRIKSIAESSSTPGIYISGMSFERLLGQLQGPFVLLKEDGEDLSKSRVPKDPVFVLSDHLDFREEEEKALMVHDPLVLSLGPRSLHADQCITIVHNELDRREAA